MFMGNERVTPEEVNAEIDDYFGKDAVKNIKENLPDKNFLAEYKRLYDKIFKEILNGIKNDSK